MKNVIISIGLVMMMIITILILYTIYGQNTRQNEVEETLSVAVEQTLENMKIDKSYDVNSTEEFIADFNQNLILSIESDSELEVNILSVDIDKGLFDVEVIETFKQPNGSVGHASCRKTIILEEYRSYAPSYYSVEFLSEKENRSGEFSNFKTFSICENSNVIVPMTLPAQKGHSFKGWSLQKPSAANGYSPTCQFVVSTDGSGNKTVVPSVGVDGIGEDGQMIVTGSLVFYAVFD